MDIDEYQRLTGETAIYPGRGGTIGVIYNALALGEAGEIQGKVSKLIRDDGIFSIADGEIDPVVMGIPYHKRAELKKELGDLMWHAVRMASDLGYRMSDVLADNLEKLSSRKDRCVIGGSGDDR